MQYWLQMLLFNSEYPAETRTGELPCGNVELRSAMGAGGDAAARSNSTPPWAPVATLSWAPPWSSMLRQPVEAVLGGFGCEGWPEHGRMAEHCAEKDVG